VAIDPSDTTWIIIATGLVMMMTPSLGFFESGLLRSKNSLSVIMQTFTGLGVLSALWFILGFSEVYGTSLSGIVGGTDFIFFNNIPLQGSLPYAPTIPGITFASYVMMLAVVTPPHYWGSGGENEMERFSCIHNCVEYFHLLSACTLGLGQRRMAGADGGF